MTPFIYRDFHDVPRMLFVLSEPVYLLDSSFSEEKDDYEDFYSVYEVTDFEFESLQQSWIDLNIDKTFICSVKVSDVKFDSSMRKQIDLGFLDKCL